MSRNNEIKIFNDNKLAIVLINAKYNHIKAISAFPDEAQELFIELRLCKWTKKNKYHRVLKKYLIALLEQ